MSIEKSLKTIAKRLERIEQRLEQNGKPTFHKDWYTIPEASEIMGKQPFTIREHCRLKRLRGKKRKCGRGKTSEWVISAEEIQRYLNEGLLPQPF